VIVRTLDGIAGTDRTVSAETWTSRRLLLADDGLGFSLHDTILEAGTTTTMWYRNHIEAVYCIEGEGEIVELDTDVVHPIRPGTVYALDAHDRHTVRARTRLRMVCVFNPPCTGQETHDETGAYPLLSVEPTADAGAAAGAPVP
jgi:L-ectoine synthase